MTSTRKTLAQTCSPFFLYLATFRRNSATSRLSIRELHDALTRELDAVRDACNHDHRLAALFERIEYALVAAADQVVLSSNWSHRAGWQTDLFEVRRYKKAEGGKRFFRLVEDVLADSSAEAAEIAECLFTCMALGFRGQLIGEKKELDKCKQQLFSKARLAGALGEHITPDAYGRNVQHKVAALPTANTLRLIAVALGSIVFMLAVWWFVVHTDHLETTSRAQDIADEIRKQRS